MKRKRILLLAISVLVLLFFSCKKNEHPPVSVKFERFDKAIFSNDLEGLVEKYPVFTTFYTQKIIQIGNPIEAQTASYFKEFQNTYKSGFYDSVKLVFSDMGKIEKQLGKALGNYKAIFPADSLPKFYTHFSGFNQAVVSSDEIISVSLENYLGKSSFYDKLGVYRYLRNKMYPEKIPSDILKILLLRKVPSGGAEANLLCEMIYQGKILYALQRCFPKKTPEDLLNYSKEQADWCKLNEEMMWQFIIEKKHLFSSDYKNIRGYIDQAPFTRGFPMESPGQTGIWLGYQIVKNYTENTNCSLTKLLKETDYLKILKQSKYNPE